MSWSHWLYAAAILIGLGVVVWWWYDNQKKNGPYEQAPSLKDAADALKHKVKGER